MKSIKQLKRLLLINWVLARNGLDEVIVSIHLFSPLRFLVYLNPWTWCRQQKLTRGQALRQTLEELGPVFVKFGQALSTRPDILPPDVANELCKLQDAVPPFSSAHVLQIIEKEFGCSAFDLFAKFEEIPLASASIAQAHAAELKTGEQVVVKILRPNIKRLIKQDLQIMYTIANLAERYWPLSKRFKPYEIVQEFERTLFDELDLQREAANCAQLRRNFLQSPLLYIPEVYWDYTRKNILVMERIYGIPIANMSALHEQGIDTKKLAKRGVEIFFTQVFRDCFFHADMHPGNIFVSPQHPHDPQYICVDFGIVGTLNDWDKRYIAENLYAFFNRDYRRVAQLHLESGWIASHTRVDEFESAIRTVCEPIFEKPLKDISLGQVIIGLLQVARRFEMQIQPQFILLQKTLIAVEGLGRQLNPELDLWTTAKPFLEKWLKEQVGVKAFFKQLRENLPFFAEHLPHMPRLVYEVLQLKKDHYLEQRLPQTTHHRDSKRIKRAWYRGFGMALLATMSPLAMLTNLNHLTLIFAAVASAGGLIVLLNLNRKNG